MTGPQLPASAPLASGADFFTRFVEDVHVLISEGFSRLDPSDLKKAEEHISGQIVRHTRQWLSDLGAPPWVEHYNVNAEDPVEGVLGANGVREGKSRPRIDIRIESSEARPRREFTFEAKRFYPKSDETKYVGGEGLGTLLNGMKGRQDLAAGMLGYVQAGSIHDVTGAVEAKLVSDRAAYGLAPTGQVWTKVPLDARIPATLLSHHTRTGGLRTLAVYHSFLPCHAAALPPSPSGL